METDSRQTSDSDARAFPGFEDLKKLIEKFQLPSVDIDALIDWQQGHGSFDRGESASFRRSQGTC